MFSPSETGARCLDCTSSLVVSRVGDASLFSPIAV